MKAGLNYKDILNKASRYPQLREEVEEITLMQIKKFNIKNNIKELKEKLEKILNDND